MNAIRPATENQNIWNSAEVVQSYTADEALQKPEQTILQLLKEQLSAARMLDLGVGAGRTTRHFAPLVREYLGADYAEKMVEICSRKFPDAGGHARFEVLDATAMHGLPDQYFDVILFSFNGIDYVAPEDRDKVFREVRRVGKTGGVFVFSSHNLEYVRQMYALKRRKRFKDFLYQFYRTAMLCYYNGLPGKFDRREYAALRDGDAHFSLTVCYVKPAFQVKQLQNSGFQKIKAYSLKTGAEVDWSKPGGLKNDAWVYYLCEI